MTKTTIHRISLLLALGVTTLLFGGCGSMPIFISTDQEIALGEEAAPEFQTELGGAVDNQQLQDYIQAVGLKVSAESDREMPYDFVLVNTDVPNAMALPGGKIFLTAGLMKLMDNEQQLAAVLGHETAHVAQRHNVRMIQDQMGIAVLASLAGAAGGEGAEAGTQIVGAMFSLSYSRENEFEADEFGAKYIESAGYNPYGMVELLEVLYSLHEEEPGKMEEMFMTHPITSERIENIRSTLIEEGSYSDQTPDPNAARFRAMHQLLVETLGQ